jgi:hypothetical protein
MAGFDNSMDEEGDDVTWFDLRYRICTPFQSEFVPLYIHYSLQCRPNRYSLSVIAQPVAQ